jgi:hypothetical protein
MQYPRIKKFNFKINKTYTVQGYQVGRLDKELDSELIENNLVTNGESTSESKKYALGFKAMFRMMLTIYLYILSIYLVFKGVSLFASGMKLVEKDYTSILIGLALAVLGILVVVVFPLKFFNGGIQRIWKNIHFEEGREVEPSIINKKHQEKRELT